MKYFYKVVGQVKEGNKYAYYRLGFTNNKSAWLKNSNGWDKKDLIFIKQVKQNPKQEYLNK